VVKFLTQSGLINRIWIPFHPLPFPPQKTIYVLTLFHSLWLWYVFLQEDLSHSFGAQRARSYLPVIRSRGLRFSSPLRWHR
jgi:hypothetical protein